MMFTTGPHFETIALLLFSAASLTDYFDGKIARRDNLITNFGILMDPLADKILVCSAFIAFVGRGWLPAWMVVIVVTRELAITGLRLLAASKNLVLAAERFGKHKTISQIVAIISVLV
ncbi:MAG TPA: CDP-diacylglycerol--glycerol-3-phosphate 3-phosphatidyltransferase, partial [Verrucomicrobiae bacterium]|nr:CDP-diacylglycerol--glycerol-3-phosphate 3-phosphatidyltransferase [Verrucomicrobiae bacterium]